MGRLSDKLCQGKCSTLFFPVEQILFQRTKLEKVDGFVLNNTRVVGSNLETRDTTKWPLNFKYTCHMCSKHFRDHSTAKMAPAAMSRGKSLVRSRVASGGRGLSCR